MDVSIRPLVIKYIARLFHGWISKRPSLVAQGYICLISLASRNVLPEAMSMRIRNSICAAHQNWPPLCFKERRIILGEGTEVFLIPHLGEIDEMAIFFRRFYYESAVFRWLEIKAPRKDDLIIETRMIFVLYSAFFDALIKTYVGRLKEAASFEPSLVTFRRLIEKPYLKANYADHITAFNAARCFIRNKIVF
jgi:hypothetical protein